jgi:hypothetical protein
MESRGGCCEYWLILSSDLPVWADLEPPKGTLYHYPVRPHHDAEYYIVGSSAPPDVGVQMWCH